MSGRADEVLRGVEGVLPGESATARAAHESLKGDRRGIRSSLVMSQVVLSFGIPFALVPLLIFCRSRDVMGTLVNQRLTTTVATVVVFLIVSLNVFLLYQTFFGA
jgi:Mn2+/Fe2+ NRAMP family transporter